MKKCALLFGTALMIGSAAAASVLDDITASLGTWEQPGTTTPLPTGPFFGDPWADHGLWSGDVPAMGVIRPMDVTVTPAWPEPFEEVVATISGRTSDPYLRLENTTVSYQGNDILIDLEWSTYTPPSEAYLNGQQSFSIGYGVEQFHPGASGSSASESYEVPVSLGGFDVGVYWIYVENHGALGGEAQASFEVQPPRSGPAPIDLGSFHLPIALDSSPTPSPRALFFNGDIWWEVPFPVHAGWGEGITLMGGD